MKKISMKSIEDLKGKIDSVEVGLNISLTKGRSRALYIDIMTISKYIDNIMESTGTTEAMGVIFECGVKKATLKKAVRDLKRQVQVLQLQYIPTAPACTSEFDIELEDRGYKPCAIEKMEGKKLILNLVEQKGYYLLQTDKRKILIQIDILLTSARLIEDLTKVSNLVSTVKSRLESLSDYKMLLEVTEFEEQVIANCYDFLIGYLDEVNIVI